MWKHGNGRKGPCDEVRWVGVPAHALCLGWVCIQGRGQGSACVRTRVRTMAGACMFFRKNGKGARTGRIVHISDLVAQLFGPPLPFGSHLLFWVDMFHDMKTQRDNSSHPIDVSAVLAIELLVSCWFLRSKGTLYTDHGRWEYRPSIVPQALEATR